MVRVTALVVEAVNIAYEILPLYDMVDFFLQF
jgi:hypothetical protein